MSKTLVCTFGPDGAGKSTFAQVLAENSPNSLAIPATRPALWPDTSWHEETTAKGIERTTTDPKYHLDTLDRCFAMASHLLQSEEVSHVILDPDPRAQLAVKACVMRNYPVPLFDFYDQLDDIAGKHLDTDVHQLNIHVTVGQGTTAERAAILLDRVQNRSEISPLDPNSIDEYQSLITACDSLAAFLEERHGENCLRIETDRPNDVFALTSQIWAA